jgi:predicted aldo/keto reductase-like oxidoreductase
MKRMYYKDFKGKKLSALGFGMMRLPRVEGGKESDVDEAAAQRMVDKAIANGINYFDTAWFYHGGNSERFAGRALTKYPRDSYYIADKFPGVVPNNWDKAEEIFEEQLRRMQTDHFDFYLFHNVCEMNVEAYLDDGKYGIHKYLIEQKKKGRITHLGFSCHGELPALRRFLDAVGDEMEFCQIQLNWFDWEFQGAKEKVDLLRERGIPVWVMEPLRGDKLAKLAPQYEEILKKLRPDEDAAAWAFRFVQSIPAVTMVLSGMTNDEQLEKNLATFAEEKLLNNAETEALLKIAKDMAAAGTVPCTACRYCTSHCPQQLDIPRLIALYNEQKMTPGGFITMMAIMALPEDKRPKACLHCHSCEGACPQNIKISDVMEDFASMQRF